MFPGINNNLPSFNPNWIPSLSSTDAALLGELTEIERVQFTWALQQEYLAQNSELYEVSNSVIYDQFSVDGEASAPPMPGLVQSFDEDIEGSAPPMPMNAGSSNDVEELLYPDLEPAVPNVEPVAPNESIISSVTKRLFGLFS